MKGTGAEEHIMVGFQNTRVLSAPGRMEIMGMKALRDVYKRGEKLQKLC